MKNERTNIYIYIMNGKIGKNRKNNPDTVPDRLFPHLHLAHAQFLSPAVAGSRRSCACPKYGNATQGPALHWENNS